MVPNNTVLGVMEAKLGWYYVTLAQKLQFSKNVVLTTGDQL